MPTTANDIEVYFARNLATFAPRTERGRLWLAQKLQAKGWQRGANDTYFTDASEVLDLQSWLRRDGLVCEIINPEDAPPTFFVDFAWNLKQGTSPKPADRPDSSGSDADDPKAKRPGLPPPEQPEPESGGMSA